MYHVLLFENMSLEVLLEVAFSKTVVLKHLLKDSLWKG